MIKHIAVVVPARNEEQRIQACLAAIQRAKRHVDVPCDVIVVADSCTDNTVALATGHAHIVTTEYGRVGAARATGIALALKRAGLDPEDVWIANTDADSLVPANWLSTQLGLAAHGYDATIGTVRPAADEYPEHLWPHWHSTHPAGQANGHIHGANLGVRASAYLDAGGFPDLAEHEDVALVTALDPLRTIATAEAEVITSARTDGRTPGGYAAYLKKQYESLTPHATPLAPQL